MHEWSWVTKVSWMFGSSKIQEYKVRPHFTVQQWTGTALHALITIVHAKIQQQDVSLSLINVLRLTWLQGIKMIGWVVVCILHQVKLEIKFASGSSGPLNQKCSSLPPSRYLFPHPNIPKFSSSGINCRIFKPINYRSWTTVQLQLVTHNHS